MSLVFVVMLLVDIVSLNVTEIVVAGELNVELSVGLTDKISGGVDSGINSAPNFSKSFASPYSLLLPQLFSNKKSGMTDSGKNTLIILSVFMF